MEAKMVYRELNKLYSSENNDNHFEMKDAITEIEVSIAEGVAPQTFIDKMKEMLVYGNINNEYKSKLSVVIMNRFWEKSFVEMIPFREFKTY